MTKHHLLLLRLMPMLPALLLTVVGLGSCSDELDDYNATEYANWKSRNEEAFRTCMDSARTAISEAQALYGDEWEDMCDWRVYRTYAQSPDTEGEATDSIVVRILVRGTGSGCPLYTDSVYVNFLGHLIPSPSYPDGKVFTFTGMSNNPTEVFSDLYCSPTLFYCGNTVEGFTTALLHMHIGDLWRVYIPYDMGYGDTEMTDIPAYSMLNYLIQLKAYYRKGVSAGSYL